MSSAVITLLGLYGYDNTLFDGLTLPEPLDKDIAINTILMRGGDYEVSYPNPIIFKQFITSWSTQKQNVFTNWNRALEDLGIVAPLENYDRREDWTDTGENHSTSTDNMSGSGSTTGSDSSTGNAGVTSTDKISADDSASFINKTQNEQSNSTTTSASTLTESTTNTESNASSDANTENVHTGRVHGNIGVTTSSTMYSDWIKVVRDYGDIYDLIATLFLQDFVIPIL